MTPTVNIILDPLTLTNVQLYMYMQFEIIGLDQSMYDVCSNCILLHYGLLTSTLVHV